MKKFILLTILVIYSIGQVEAQSWKCPENIRIPEFKSSDCFFLKAPLNYDSDNTEKIDLFVRKFPAKRKRKGSIWLIPGGPGESGATLYPLINQFSELFPHMDIFIPDHRGTGYSSKICPKEEVVDSPGGMALSNDEWGPCFDYMYSNPNYAKAFTITNAAKDLSLLINELSGQGERYIYGVSYGTQLVLRLLQLGTTNLDAVILDSLVPLQDDEKYDLSRRSFITNEVGLSFLQKFDETFPNHISIREQLKNVIERAEKDQEFANQLPKQDLTILFGMMLDIPYVRNKIPEIIKSLNKGDFKPLQNSIAKITSFHQEYGANYQSSPNSIPLTQIITASENNLRPDITKANVAQESRELLFKSPLPNLIAENTMPTYKRDNYFGKIPKQMPPTLILHGNLDPKTHIEGARKHYKVLKQENPSISFIEINSAPHFIALFAPNVFRKAVREFIRKKSIEDQTMNEKTLSFK